MNNMILRDLTYGVYVIGSKDGNRDVGCIANSVMQITSNPASIAISINHDNYTNKCIKECNKFSVSILNVDSNLKIIGTFGFSSSKDVDKFNDFDSEVIDGVSVVKDANGYIICDVVNVLETETHTIFIGKVVSMNKFNDKIPMSYKYYHEVLKGSSSSKAPTYINNVVEEIKGSRWKCMICGYIYEGNDLPLDYVCPICGQNREAFEKIET